MSDYKFYIVVRGDLDMPPGKLAAQAGHAVLHGFLEAPAYRQALYIGGKHAYKITLKAKNLHAIERAEKECQDAGIPVRRITDAGFTVFDGPTVTCLGIGPCTRDELPAYVAKMQML